MHDWLKTVTTNIFLLANIMWNTL